MKSTGARAGEFSRGWKPLLACGVGIGLGLSPLPTFSLGIIAVELNKEFGWSRAVIMAVSILTTASLLVLGPVIGRLADRHGARRVALWSTIGLGIALATGSLIQPAIWTFYLMFGVMSVLGLGTLPITYAKVVNLWFDKARGLALGIALCATGITGFLVPAYVQTIVQSLGWRWAFVGLALLPLLIATPILWLLLKDNAPAWNAAEAGTPPTLDGVSIPAALRNYRFWIMAASALVAGAGLNGMVSNFVPILIDQGMTGPRAAEIFGLVGLSLIVGRLSAGWLFDRQWAPMVACVFLCLPAAAAQILAGHSGSTAVIAMATILLGLASGAEFDIVAYLTSRYFGRRNFGALYALQYAFFGLGAGFAPSVFGWTRDVTGAYDSVLRVVSLLFVASGAMLLLLGRYPPTTAHQTID